MSDIIKISNNKTKAIKELTARVLAEFYNDGVNISKEKLEKATKVAEGIYAQRQRKIKKTVRPTSAVPDVEPQAHQKKKKQALTIVETPITEKHQRILDLAAATHSTTAKEVGSLVFMAKPFVQTTLPHRDPGNVKEWVRRNGRVALIIQSTGFINPLTDQYENLGIPYGTIPRLLLIWITTQILYDKDERRILTLGDNLSDFMRKVGLDPRQGGKRGDIARLKLQMLRLFRCVITVEENVEEGNRVRSNWMNMQVVEEGSMSWAKKDYRFKSLQAELEELDGSGWIKISERFYNMVKNSCVPLDYRIIKKIKQSPLALDLYCWMVHRTWSPRLTVNPRPSFVTWQQLHDQFGSNYADVSNFKKKIKPYLRIIKSTSNNLCLREARGGLHITPKISEKESTKEL